MQHDESQRCECQRPENAYRKPMEEPEARPRCRISQEGAKGCDSGGEEEPGEEATQAHTDREDGRPKPEA